MKLVETNEKIDDEIEIVELLNEYFVNIVKKNQDCLQKESEASTKYV